MNRALGLFVIGLVFGGGFGFIIAAGNGITFDGHDHADPAVSGAMAADQPDAGHDAAHAALLEVPAVDAPEVTLDLTRDPTEGFNLQVRTRNFNFTPKASGLAHVAGEGHAHVNINGKKVGRLYGEWMHIAHLPEGEVTVEVALNSNDHRPLAVAGQPITASTRLIVE